MQQKESYDVLRLIEHGQICYISSENVQGRTLARYLKYHPVMEKKEMFLLLKAIAEQLELIHRCRGNPCYQYVNPYSIILAEDGRGLFSGYESRDKHETGSIYAKEGHAGIFSPSGRELLSKCQ